MKKDSNLKFILQVAGQEKRKLYVSAFLSVLSSLLSVMPYILMYHIILELLQKDNIDIYRVKELVFLTIALVILRFISITLAAIFSHVSAFTILYELRMKAVEHISKLNMGFYNDNSTSKLKKILNEDIERLENFIAHQVPELAAVIVTPALIFIYLFYLDYKLALVMLIPLGISILVQKTLMAGFKERMMHYHMLMQELNSSIIQYITGMQVFKAFNLSAKSFDRYRKSTEGYADYWKDISKKMAMPYALFSVVIDSSMLFIVPIGGVLYLMGEVNIATFLLFLVLSRVFLNSFSSLREFAGTFAYLLQGANEIRTILEKEKQESGQLEISAPIRSGIEFSNVSFSYGGNKVFDNLSLEIKNNTSVALVGPSGGGKTTIAQLIGRFWDVDEGEILIDGKNIKEISIENLMKNISFVFQDVFLLQDTIYENIAMGDKVEESKVIEAAKKAQIHDFIMTLPKGYKTIIGKDGVQLSGGEKQRVSIARAILKDSQIVVLDEATSFCDAENEVKIQRALGTLLKDRTAIIIAHRLNTIRNIENIIVFDEGKIVESGNHHELIENNGLYSHLWNIYLNSESVNIKGGEKTCLMT